MYPPWDSTSAVGMTRPLLSKKNSEKKLPERIPLPRTLRIPGTERNLIWEDAKERIQFRALVSFGEALGGATARRKFSFLDAAYSGRALLALISNFPSSWRISSKTEKDMAGSWLVYSIEKNDNRVDSRGKVSKGRALPPRVLPRRRKILGPR